MAKKAKSPVEPYTLSEGRYYEHRGCGVQTGVTEEHFDAMADPFHRVVSSWCHGCNDFVPIGELRWADTGEDMVKYRKRLWQATPPVLRAWRLGLGAGVGGLVAALLGAGIAALVSGFPPTVFVAALFAAIGGGILNQMVVNRLMTRHVFKVDYLAM